MPGPLEGVRVVELAEGWAGPYCGMCFGDLGASVVKVEPPQGDFTRELGPPFVGDTAALFWSLNRNKRGVTADVRSEAGQALLRRLAAWADVWIDDAERAREHGPALDPDELRRINPRLVSVCANRFGTEGPWVDRPAEELEVQGVSILTTFLGGRGEPPVRNGSDVAGINGGQAMFHAAMAGLLAAQESGRGDHADISLLAVQMAVGTVMLCALDNPDRWLGFHTSARGNAPDYGFRTADDPFYFGAPMAKDEDWLTLCDAIEAPELAVDPRFSTRAARTPRTPELKPIIEQVFMRFPLADLMRRINEAGGIAVAINDHKTLFEHEQVLANGMLARMPMSDGTEMDCFGVPWELTGTPAGIRLAPPRLGEHDAAVRAELEHEEN